MNPLIPHDLSHLSPRTIPFFCHPALECVCLVLPKNQSVRPYSAFSLPWFRHMTKGTIKQVEIRLVSTGARSTELYAYFANLDCLTETPTKRNEETKERKKEQFSSKLPA